MRVLSSTFYDVGHTLSFKVFDSEFTSNPSSHFSFPPSSPPLAAIFLAWLIRLSILLELGQFIESTAALKRHTCTDARTSKCMCIACTYEDDAGLCTIHV